MRKYLTLRVTMPLTTIDDTNVMSCHVIVAAGANPSLVSGRGQGTLDKSPAHRRAMMSNVGFSISLKDTSTCSSALPGAGI